MGQLMRQNIVLVEGALHGLMGLLEEYSRRGGYIEM